MVIMSLQYEGKRVVNNENNSSQSEGAPTIVLAVEMITELGGNCTYVIHVSDILSNWDCKKQKYSFKLPPLLQGEWQPNRKNLCLPMTRSRSL